MKVGAAPRTRASSIHLCVDHVMVSTGCKASSTGGSPDRLGGRMSAMRHVGRSFLVGISVALMTSLVACGDDSGQAAPPSTGAVSDDPTGEPFPLPFGLVQLDGTAAIGRPVVYDHEPYTFNNVP